MDDDLVILSTGYPDTISIARYTSFVMAMPITAHGQAGTMHTKTGKLHLGRLGMLSRQAKSLIVRHIRSPDQKMARTAVVPYSRFCKRAATIVRPLMILPAVCYAIIMITMRWLPSSQNLPPSNLV